MQSTTHQLQRRHRSSGRATRGVALLGAGLVALVSACSGDLPGSLVVGSGEPTTETRQVSGFTEVEAGGGIRVDLARGATKVEVTAQPNLLPLTSTTVSGARLTVSTTKGYTSTSGITVRVTAPSLTAITLNGGASATGSGFDEPSLSIDLSGGARLSLAATVGDLDLKASGGAILELERLEARTARVDLSGGVVATLAVSSSLRGTASGGVVVNLARRPDTLDVETSGGAAVVGP